MSFWIDEATLSLLFPLSFLTDGRGCIRDVGLPLRERCPGVRPGVDFAEVFELVEPAGAGKGGRAATPELSSLVTRGIRLLSRTRPEMRLRGRVIRMGSGEAYLFTLAPEAGEGPILSRLLAVFQSDLDSSMLIQEGLRAVCQGLGYDGGVFHPAPVGEDAWMGTELTFGPVHGSPTEETGLWQQALREQRVIWAKEGDPAGHCSRVAVPISSQGRIQAVCEFHRDRQLASEERRDQDPNPDLMEDWMQEQALRAFGLLLGGGLETRSWRARDQEQAARLLNASKMASLGEIAAGIAHEINNPLAILSVSNQMLGELAGARDPNLEGMAKHVGRINACVRRISKIMASLGDFSRDSSEDAMEPASIRTILSETLDLCSARFFHHRVDLQVPEAAPDLRIDCRASQISQVLLNLLNNAFDAVQESEERWVRVGLEDSGEEVELSVMDSGNGIPPEIAAGIMRPFFTTKGSGKGTGLGLSISSKIVAEHQGRLWLEQGAANTCFRIRLKKRLVS